MKFITNNLLLLVNEGEEEKVIKIEEGKSITIQNAYLIDPSLQSGNIIMQFGLYLINLYVQNFMRIPDENL
jgi:hypothetical protein